MQLAQRRPLLQRLPTAVLRIAAVASFVALAPGVAPAQLRQTIWRSAAGQVYQVLQYRAGDDLGSGADELRITSVAANSFSAGACGNPPATSPDNTVEALASGPIGGARPLDLAYKSSVIADASEPCFSASANDGLGGVCFGPGCDGECNCSEGADCAAFSVVDSTQLGVATPDAPAAHLIVPLTAPPSHCDVPNHVSYGFGTSAVLTTQAVICDAAPADGVRLAGTPSAFAGGRDGTTIVFAYEALPQETVGIAAAGFGIDSDGRSPFACDHPGRIVASLLASDNQPPPPPPPPLVMTSELLRCQSAIGRASVRFAGRCLRALQLCRDKILAGAWQLQAHDCANHPYVERSLSSAARLARSGIRASCQNADMRSLLTCGDTVDDLFAPSLAGGCLYSTHLDNAERAAAVAYGF